MMRHHGLALVTALSLLTTACASADAVGTPGGADLDVAARIDAISAAVEGWGDATTLAEAKADAEAALNLVVGPNGPGYGDSDGDGVIQGETERGLLPGLMGEEGLAQSEPINECVEADVLGGSWDDPAARWAAAQGVYDAWTPSNNTMPSLPSHPQRIVGWATLTLATGSLDEAHEFAGHAQIHVDVTRDAFDSCTR